MARAISVYRLAMSVCLSVRLSITVWLKFLKNLSNEKDKPLKTNQPDSESYEYDQVRSIDLYGNFDIDLGIVDLQGQIATIHPALQYSAVSC